MDQPGPLYANRGGIPAFGHQGGAQRGALWLSDEGEAQAAADVQWMTMQMTVLLCERLDEVQRG